MTFGQDYAALYDALYEAKDYPAEARFALDQLGGHIPAAGARLLDLGCGTGLHAIEFARRGHRVTGVDRSEAMIAKARARIGALPSAVADRLDFKVADLRSADEGRRFDAVVSLFRVIGYMTDDEMLTAALGAARRHLGPGGAFLFDFWHRAAVLAEPPRPRTRAVELAGRRITRSTTPRWEPDRDLVYITYEMRAEGEAQAMSSETHTVRYFSPDELREHLQRAGFWGCNFGEWLTGADPARDSFSVYCVASVE